MWDVDRLTRAGSEAWPGIVVPREVIEELARERSTGEEDDRIEAADLYLAIALERGEHAALHVFERVLVPGMRAALGRACTAPSVIDEVIQLVRVKVLVGSTDAPAKIRSYTGRGTLLAWLRVTAMRTLSNLARGERRAPGYDAPARSVLDVAGSVSWPSPERLLLGERYGSVLREALGTAMRELPPRDRTLMRLHYVEGLALERIATVYAVHKSTVSRWLSGAREELLRRAVAAVRAEVSVAADTEELESLCTYLCSRLDLSLSGLFASQSQQQ
ncbi:MAG: sigma-70 family RNA polymerase sigma factor [Kofleriaceae bacterium]|nr:sigma-70 family RNA polymerase sigma factor [Kofleriaceae bacterium]